MPTEQILALMIQERDKLNRAIEALSGGALPKRRGRPPANSNVTAESGTPKRKLSAAGRKAIADATRKRWKLIKAGKAQSSFSTRAKRKAA